MTTTINGRTPEEIKKGLECCAEYGNCSEGCPYNLIKDCGHDLYSDALALIQQLERERDAAVEDLRKIAKIQPLCTMCKHNPGLLRDAIFANHLRVNIVGNGAAYRRRIKHETRLRIYRRHIMGRHINRSRTVAIQ